VGTVYPGASYDLLEEQENWYKIEVGEGVEAWVYAQYVEKK
jgi:uncharacterized protein YgiM (DUF1202 family)